MTNKEKYRQAFSAIQVSEEFTKELKNMKPTKTFKTARRFSSLAACLALCVLLLAGTTVAYAADIGGFRQTVQLWIRGEKTEAQVEFNGMGQYDMEYVDSEGNVQHQSGGGIAIDDDGNEIPLTNEDLMERLDDPELCYEDDGRVMIYWRNQEIDITDLFQDGYAYVTLKDGNDTLYLTVEEGGGYASSHDGYVSPWEFSTKE